MEHLTILKTSKISLKCELIVLVVCTFLVGTIIVMNTLIFWPLFIEGLNFIYDYQSAQPYTWIHVIENLISLLCNPIGIAVVLVIYYIVSKRKLMQLVHISYFLFMTYIIALLKQALQQSRPIWYDSRMENWQWFCPKDFGNPSGHSFAVSLLYEPIFSDGIGNTKYRIEVLFMVILCILVPVSRMYLGVHSANQILFGLTEGFLHLVLFKFVYQKGLYELYWQMLMGKKRLWKILTIIVLNILVIVIPIIFYENSRRYRPMNEKDITNLNQQCNSHLTGVEVQGHMLTACAVGCVIFGMLYGFMLLKDIQGYRKYLLGFWVFESCLKFILKIIVYIICAALPAVVFFLIGYFAVQNSIGKYILYCCCTLVGGFGLSYFAPMLTLKWKIMQFLPGPAEINMQLAEQAPNS